MLAAALAAFTSCADDKYETFRTASTDDPNYAYLNDYADLKTYVDRAKYPNFKLCGATSASEFNKQELVYALDVSNFDELVTGNDFKMGSVVSADGTMDFSTIQTFIKNATDAGLSVYGHNLVWHSQQPVKWLNSLIADRVPTGSAGNNDVFKYTFDDGKTMGGWGNNSTRTIISKASHDGTACLEINNPTKTNSWSAQVAADFSEALKVGKTYTLTLWIKGDNEGSITAGFQNPNGYKGCGDFPVINFSKDWQKVTVETACTGEGATRFLFNVGAYAGKIDIDDVELYTPAAATVQIPKNDYKADFEDGTALTGWGNSSTREVVSGSHDGSKCMKVNNPSKTNSWSCQCAIDFSDALKEGETYYLHFWAKADAEGTVGANFQNPSNYSGRGDFPAFTLTNQWKEFTLSTKVTGDNCKRLTLNLGALAGNMYFDDVELYHMVASNTIPLTDKEKKDTLTWAMDRWIKGMMEACDGKVKAWDLVNEPMSDAAPAELKTAARDAGEDADKNFYWQDYLGKDYARTAAALARKYGPEDIKLFINDYNLEAAYNNNAKCDGLINMIKYWESDGVTKIDGIGTQMHVTYSMNPTTQAANEAAVTNMFKKLAATGKLIRVSELDMGIADKDGNTIYTENVTEDEHHAMAAYYKFIVEQYLSLIPVDQQYGICAWGITDSKKGSGWRPGEPIGLWTVNYTRKHTYAGFADGLAGK